MSADETEPSRDFVPPTLSPSDRGLTPDTPAPDGNHLGPYFVETLPLSPGSAVVAPPSVNGYEILGELGRGGMGVVYKARQLKLNRLVALKMILSGEFARHEEVKRFLDEAEAVAQLEHPNIIRIYDVSEHEGRPYFAMELADAGCLADRLSGRPLEAVESARLVETISRAMAHAHQRGIVHRDLKPVNVLMSTFGSGSLDSLDLADGPTLAMLQPKVTDFGLAKRMDSHGRTETGRVIGTVNYMAPEQAEGRSRDIGPHTDVYGLGAILYELLTGRPPFQADSIVAVLEKVRNADPQTVRALNPACPRDLETICLKCLEKEHGRRYPGAQELADDLVRFLQGEPIKARPVGTIERVWRSVQRRRREVLLALCTLLALGALAGFLVHQEIASRRDRRQAVEVYRGSVEAVLAVVDALDSRDRGADEIAAMLDDLPRHYQQMQQRVDDAPLQSSAADACNRLGEALWRSGRKNHAAEACTVAIRLYSVLLESDPDAGRLRDALAMVHLRQARIRADFRDLDAAMVEVRAALAELDTLCKAETDEPDYRRHHAEAHHQLGELLDTRKERREAVTAYLASIAIRARLVEGDPRNRSYRRDLARGHGYLGDTWLELGEKDKAKAAYDEAERIRQQLSDEKPGDPESLFQVARSHSNSGLFALWAGDPKKAEEAYTRAEAIQRDLRRDHPLVADYKADLGWSLLTLAELRLDRLGPTSDALAPAREARTIFERLLKDSAGDRGHVRNLARALLLLAQESNDADLTARAETLLRPRDNKQAVEDPEVLYQLAVLSAMKAKLEPARRDEHVDQAMSDLDAAIHRGYARATRLKPQVRTLGILWTSDEKRMTNIVRRCERATMP